MIAPEKRENPAPESRVLALNGSDDSRIERPFDQTHVKEIRLGFSAPDDRLTSLNIPAEGPFGEMHPSLSFDIEFDQERPDIVTVSLMDLDDDHFVQSIHRTVRFPARLLAELLSRRKATAEEATAWQVPESGE